MKRFATLASLCAVLALSPLSSLRAQDSCAVGLTFGTAHAVGPFDAYASLQDGTRVVFDGMSVDHVDANGLVILHLGGYAAYVYPSFVLLAPDESFALVGESSTGGIERFELNGAPQSTVGGVTYNYDALFEDADHILVSADRNGGFHNQLVRLELATGATTLVAQLDGPSGPLARRARTGEVFIGLVNLAQPNHDRILRFDTSQLASGLVLGVGDGQVFADLLPNVASLRIDERYDAQGIDFWRLYLAISPFGSPSTIACFDPSGTRLPDVATSQDSISNLELQTCGPLGAFGPWQPDAGERLRYRGTTWCYPGCDTAEVRTLVPQRPQASIHGPGLGNPAGGRVRIEFDGCVPNASVVLLLGPSALYSPAENTCAHIDGFLWHSSLAWSPLRKLATLTTDASGHASYTFKSVGSYNGTLAFQGLIRDAGGKVVGSSTCVLN